MKKRLSLFLMCCMAAVLMTSCHLNDPNDPLAGLDKVTKACWKVTTTFSRTGQQDKTTVSYYWGTEYDAGSYVLDLTRLYNSDAVKIEYVKSDIADEHACYENGGVSGNAEEGDVEGQFFILEEGIYMNDKDHSLLAKGTDGSIFEIPDVEKYMEQLGDGTNYILPEQFKAWDGKQSEYSFDSYIYPQPFSAEYDTVSVVAQEKYCLPSEAEELKGRWQYKMLRLEEKGYHKVEEGADFENMYVAIAEWVQKGGRIVKPSEMVQQYAEHHGDHWLRERYPADMETQKYVFEYTGRGTLSSMGVARAYNWGQGLDDLTVLWLYPCKTDDVNTVGASYEDVPEEDARAFIAKVKAEGKYSESNESEEDTQFGFSASSFGTERPAGINTIVYPHYNITYYKDYRSLYIGFNVERMVYRD